MRKEEKVKMKEARDREKALARKERALDRAMRESFRNVRCVQYDRL
jgi:hypothetical protein